MSDFGDFLYVLRKDKGMTQAELAETLGVTNKAVSKWETGESMPETSLLLPLSRIFGVTVDELLSGKRKESSQATAKDSGSGNAEENDLNGSDNSRQDCGRCGDCDCDTDKTRRTDGEKNRKYIRVERGDTVVTVVADDLNNLSDLDNLDESNINGHLFSEGKKGGATLIDKIWGAVFASLALVGILTYVLIGTLTDVWHPTWVIIPCFILSSGILGSILDMCNAKKREEKIKRGENPYTGGICGIIMLTCIIVFLLLGAFAGLWHPCWAIPVGGAVICGIVGAIGDVILYKRNNKQ